MIERIIEELIRQQVVINEMQNANFNLKQLEEKYIAKKKIKKNNNKKLYFISVGLRRSFDRVSRDVI